MSWVRSILAVVRGVVTAILVMVLALVVAAAVATLSGQSMAQFTHATQGLPFTVGALLVGAFAEFVGGWHAGRLAGQREIVHGAAVGFVLTAGGVFLTASLGPTMTAFDVAGLLTSIPAAMLGGFVARAWSVPASGHDA